MGKTVKREILGNSPAVLHLKKMIEKVAPAGTSILVIGESGTGKELVARAIHDLSPVSENAFVAVNCGAIPENLIESELFGHKKGSFTGAIADKPGLFETANGGTLFLDEIGELPLHMQVKLLRALQDRAIRRVGENKDIKIDARIVAATNRNLEEAVKHGTFREDLYYRLNVILLELPPLRTRPGDVELLATEFLKKISARMNRSFDGFSPEAHSILILHKWPGNVRELENVIERAATLETGKWIRPEAFPPEMVRAAMAKSKDVPTKNLRADFTAGPIDLEATLEEVRDFYRAEALRAAGGDAVKAKTLLEG